MGIPNNHILQLEWRTDIAKNCIFRFVTVNQNVETKKNKFFRRKNFIQQKYGQHLSNRKECAL